MKSKFLIALVAILMVGFTTQAQDLKIGYTNIDYILSQLPEAKQIQADLESYQKQLQTQLQSKAQELQEKIADYQQTVQNMTDLVRQDREEELQQLEQRYRKFQQDADQSIQKKQADLLQPAYEKIQKAIEEVAKANNYTHIFSDGSAMTNVLLYARPEDDVTEMVLTKMGVTSTSQNTDQ